MKYIKLLILFFSLIFICESSFAVDLLINMGNFSPIDDWAKTMYADGGYILNIKAELYLTRVWRIGLDYGLSTFDPHMSVTDEYGEETGYILFRNFHKNVVTELVLSPGKKTRPYFGFGIGTLETILDEYVNGVKTSEFPGSIPVFQTTTFILGLQFMISNYIGINIESRAQTINTGYRNMLCGIVNAGVLIHFGNSQNAERHGYAIE